MLNSCTFECLPIPADNSLRWRHNEWDGVSNHQPHDCLLNRLSGCRSKKTSKPRVTGLCAGNSPGTGEFPAQMASNADTVSIWWRYAELENTTPVDHYGTYKDKFHYIISGIIVCIRPVNGRRRYNVTSSPIGKAHAQNDPCNLPKWSHQE